MIIGIIRPPNHAAKVARYGNPKTLRKGTRKELRIISGAVLL